jgi:hypothetical protein
MNKNKNKLFMFLILGIIVMPVFASAASILGGVENDVLDTVKGIITYEFTIPAAKLYGGGTASAPWTVPVWMLFAGFAAVYAILWLASGMLPLFKAEENKRSRIIFVIAITIITLFATPVMIWILKLVTLFTTLAYIALLILGIYTIWTLFRSGWASNSAMNSESKKTLADATRLSAEAARENKQTESFEHKTAQAEKNGLKQQVKAIKGLNSDLSRVLKDFADIKSKGTYPPAATTVKRISTDMNKISTDTGKILTFQTQNDRIMAGMSASNYKTGAASPLNALDASGFSKIKAGVDSETNDLGRSISAIAQTIRNPGITAGTINNLLGWTEAAINITNRMQRDIVLEEQMIDKI